MKRILAFILAVILIVPVFVACDNMLETEPGETPSETTADGGELLAGKNPKELYDDTKTKLKDATDYQIKVTMTESVDFAGELLSESMYYEYCVKGEAAYTKYVGYSENEEERWNVDGVSYFSVDGEKSIGAMDKASFRNAYILRPDGMILTFKDEAFEDVLFEKAEDNYTLTLTMTAEEYGDLTGDEIANDAIYTMIFDGEGALLSVKLSVDYAASNGVYIDFDRVYEYETKNVPDIQLPEDLSAYRKAPALSEIDMTTVSSLDGVTESETATDYVLIDVADYGKILIRLFPNVAPATVANFKKLVSEKHYDGTIFHRVIKDFMIQGGDGEETDSIKGEFTANGFINNLSHLRGVVSMARAQSYNSASDQFFIMHKTTNIDGQYAAFGFTVYGQDVVDAIAAVETDTSDKPQKDIVINTIRFVNVK